MGFSVLETTGISHRVFACQGSKHPEERARTGREECEILEIDSKKIIRQHIEKGRG